MGYNQENFRRIREEYSRKYLLVQEAATKRREEIHAILPEVREIDAQLSDMGLRIMHAALKNENYQEAMAQIETQSKALEQKRALVLTYLDAVEAMFKLPERVIAVDNFMKEPIKKTTEFCMEKIRLCGAEGKA